MFELRFWDFNSGLGPFNGFFRHLAFRAGAKDPEERDGQTEEREAAQGERPPPPVESLSRNAADTTERRPAEMQQAERRAEIAERFCPGRSHRHEKIEGRADPGESA